MKKVIVSRTKKLARALGRAASPWLPLHVGPVRWRNFVTRSRVRRARTMIKTDPRAAWHLLSSVAASREAQRTLRDAAAAFVDSGGHHAILNGLGELTDPRNSSLGELIALRELARQTRATPALSTLDALLAERPPKTQEDVDVTASVLRLSDPIHLRSYARVAELSTGDWDLGSVYGGLAELALLDVARVGSASEVSRQAEKVVADHPDGVRIVVSALVRARSWNELAKHVDRHFDSEHGSRRPFPLSQVVSAAKGAFRAGANSAAEALASSAIAHGAKDAKLRGIHREALDQRTILESGWHVGPVHEAQYVPRDRSILALLGQSLPIRSGGYATRSHGILTGLAAHGWSVDAATRYGFPYDLWWAPDDPRPTPGTEVVDDIPYHRLLKPGVREYPRVPLREYIGAFSDAVVDLATDKRVGLIHAASLSDVGLAGMTAARQLGLPFVYEMRGLKQLLDEARIPELSGSERERYLDVLETTVALNADRVLVITRALGEWVESKGVSPDRIVVVPNGVHVDQFQPRERDAALEAELGLGGKTVIGYAGGLVVYEGLELLLEAAAKLGQQRDDFHILLVGDGAHERVLRRRARELGVDRFVTFAGRVPHDEVSRYLSLVDIAPFPRLPLPVCELISPIKPFESMAMGKAIVVSDVAALTEFVRDGETGRTFKKGQATDLARVLDELLSSPELRARLGTTARQWVHAHRDWSAITTIVDGVYRDLLRPPEGR